MQGPFNPAADAPGPGGSRLPSAFASSENADGHCHSPLVAPAGSPAERCCSSNPWRCPPTGVTIHPRPQVGLSIHRPRLRPRCHHTTVCGVIRGADRLSLPAEQSSLGHRSPAAPLTPPARVFVDLALGVAAEVVAVNPEAVAVGRAQVRANTVWACNAAGGEPAPISWGTTPSDNAPRAPVPDVRPADIPLQTERALDARPSSAEHRSPTGPSAPPRPRAAPLQLDAVRRQLDSPHHQILWSRSPRRRTSQSEDEPHQRPRAPPAGATLRRFEAAKDPPPGRPRFCARNGTDH